MTWKNEIKKNDSSLTDETKEAFAKIEEQIREAFESIDFNLLMGVIMPHGRTKGTYKDKEELVEHLTQEAINRIKSNR